MQLLVLALAALVSAAVVATFLQVGGAPEPGHTRDRAVLGAGTAAAVDSCSDVLLVGVDGGGERPTDDADFGPTASVFRRAFTQLADAGDRSVEAKHIVFAGAGPGALIGPRVRMSDEARRAVPVRLARAWRSGVADGVAHTLEAIDAAAYTALTSRSCWSATPTGRLGRAPGAAPAPGPSRRARPVVGAALVSDPDRHSRSVAGHPVGAPVAAAAGAGILSRLLGPTADVPADTATYGTWNVCSAGDLVLRTPARARSGRR